MDCFCQAASGCPSGCISVERNLAIGNALRSCFCHGYEEWNHLWRVTERGRRKTSSDVVSEISVLVLVLIRGLGVSLGKKFTG